MKYFVLLAVLCFASSIQGVWIESPKVTNWGQWGPEEFCEEGFHVTGFRMKVQPDQGPFLDDTALNAIELHCTSNNGTGGRHVIMSREGIKGSWGTTYECPLGAFGTGFQMKTEPEQAIDNTAANSFELFCNTGEVLQGEGGEWGDWTGPVHCPRDTHVCGIMTQVEDPALEPPTGGTGINNVNLYCCNI